ILPGLTAVEQPVLVEVPATLERALPEGDVVVLRAREVEQCRSEAVRLDHPQVDLQTVVEDDARLGGAAAEDIADLVVAGQGFGEEGRVVRAGYEIDIADAVAPAAVGTSHLEATDAWYRGEAREQRLDDG